MHIFYEPVTLRNLCKTQESTCLTREYILTIGLPPAEIVSKVAVARIQDNTAIKTWGIQQQLVPKKFFPVKHIWGRELGHHMGHELTVRKKKGRKWRKWCEENKNIKHSEEYFLIAVPCSSLKQCRCLLKNKAELITLTIRNHNVLKFGHDTACTMCHQAESSVIVRLWECVLLCKPEIKHSNNSVRLYIIRLIFRII